MGKKDVEGGRSRRCQEGVEGVAVEEAKKI